LNLFMLKLKDVPVTLTTWLRHGMADVHFRRRQVDVPTGGQKFGEDIRFVKSVARALGRTDIGGIALVRRNILKDYDYDYDYNDPHHITLFLGAPRCS